MFLMKSLLHFHRSKTAERLLLYSYFIFPHIKLFLKCFLILLWITITESLAYIIAGIEQRFKNENLCRETAEAHNCSFRLFLLCWNLQRNTEGLHESYENHLMWRQKVAFIRVRLFKRFYNPCNWTELTWILPGFYWQTPAACWFEELFKINQTLPLLHQAVIRAGGGGAGS